MHGLIRHVSVNRAKFLALLMSSLFSTSIALGKAQSGQGGTNAYQINGKVVTLEEISEENKAAFYEIQKKTYATVEETAKSQYLEDYWKKLAHKRGVTVEKAEADFMKSKMKLQESEIKATLERFKDHPQLSKISKDEQRKKIVEFLEQQKKVSVIQTILLEAMSSNKLVILYPEPEEPVYNVKLTDDDNLRYGPKKSDIEPQPKGCKGNDCSIVIVEYSEFQCPFCARVIPDTERLMKEYKGKIVWAVRDYPLPFHDRAKAAAKAAHCSASQKKYWEMYYKLFENQRKLSDSDFQTYAKSINLNMEKFNNCYKTSGKIDKLIDSNAAEGAKLGVTGTPAFFINGVRLSGAQPYSEFKKIIEKQLKKNDRS